mmetsp:Transcript_1730/g.5430  ORF Transcript_1730/g.5430 Transcript_1730/m.5430 type:complete len:318 (+) Transcript_1730:430-1383(+)
MSHPPASRCQPSGGCTGGTSESAAMHCSTEIQGCLQYWASTQRQCTPRSCGRNGACHVFCKRVARRCSSQTSTTRCCWTPSARHLRQLRRAGLFSFCPAIVACSIADCNMVLLLKTRPAVFVTDRPSFEGINEMQSRTLKLSPKGMSCMTQLPSISTDTSSPTSSVEIRKVAEVKVEGGANAEAGHGHRRETVRTFEHLAPAGRRSCGASSSSSQGPTVTSVKSWASKTSRSRQPRQSSARRPWASAPRHRGGRVACSTVVISGAASAEGRRAGRGPWPVPAPALLGARGAWRKRHFQSRRLQWQNKEDLPHSPSFS